jgi:predicted membrane protein
MKFSKQTYASPYAALEAKYSQSRASLWFVVITSFVNLFMILTGSYFLFAPSMPTMLIEFTLMGAGEEGVEISALVVPFIFGVVLTLPYLLSAIFSKKRVGWMIAALAFFSIDCLYLLIMYEITSVLIDILFHAWVMFSLITGVINGFKLKKMSEEEPAAETVTETVTENSFDTFDQKDFSYDTENDNK